MAKIIKGKSSSAKQEMAQRIKVDPILAKQINEVASESAPVEAVIMLHPDDPAQLVASPERVQELTHEVLQRVEKQLGTGVVKVNIFRNLGSFAISAEPHFIRELLQQPEVASAMANKRSTQAYIPPVHVETVTPGSNRG